MSDAVGILEVYGLACAFIVADAGCKAANVKLEAFDKNKPGNVDNVEIQLLVCVKFRGSVVDVEMAIEAAVAKAEEVGGMVQCHVIARPTEDTQKLLKLNGFDKD